MKGSDYLSDKTLKELDVQETFYSGIFIDYPNPIGWKNESNLTAREQLELLIHQYGLENLKNLLSAPIEEVNYNNPMG